MIQRMETASFELQGLSRIKESDFGFIWENKLK
jgi:hypothetical protein